MQHAIRVEIKELTMRLSQILWLTPFISFITGYILVGLLYKNNVLIAPSLVGQSLDKALITLSSQNLNARIIAHKDEPDLPEGTILSQTPAPGKAIKENQALYLVIAQKPAPLQTPNLQEKTIEEAAKMVEAQSLHPKFYALPADEHSGKCIAQFPTPGMSPVDNTVIIYTAQQNKPVIMPNLKNRSVDEIVSFLNLNGINPTLLHAQQIAPGHQCTHCLILDQRPLPGTLVIFSADKPLSVQLQIG